MEELQKLMTEFEDKNNMSIVVSLFSDGSLSVNEFWDEERLYEGDSISDLKTFLSETQYKLGSDGRCLSPVQKIKP